MQVYLVGGAVRDQLLGLKGADRDYVVVGSTVEEMKKLGFNQVGRDFPVFLHPKTHEEYALARTERKNGHGFCPGFLLSHSLYRPGTLYSGIHLVVLFATLIAPKNCGSFCTMSVRAISFLPSFIHSWLKVGTLS